MAEHLLPKFYQAHKQAFDFSGTYLYDVKCSSSLLAASASNHVIKLYDPLTLSTVGTLEGHKGNIVNFSFSKSDENIIVSASNDGTVRLWDVRTRTATGTVYTSEKGHVYTSFGFNCDESLLAVGTELQGEDAHIIIWDSRNPKPLATFSESHMDDITQIVFHPANPKMLCSGGMDGLVCVFELETMNEEEEMTTVMNPNYSISKLGFFGPEASFIYATSHSETLHLWQVGEAVPLANFDHPREDLAPIVQVDYFVEPQYDADSGRLYIVAGTSEGAVVILHVNRDNLQHVMTLPGGHSETIRSFTWNMKAQTLITGGEDALLVRWTTNPTAVAGPAPNDLVMHSSHSTKHHQHSFKPY
eukprot:Colp12_sorted_trinity150504_noHs@10693